MSTRKLTLKSETQTRASDEILVLSASQINDNIYPNEIFLANNKHISFRSTAAADDAYIFRQTNDALYIANLKASEEIILVVTMASTNQRTLRLKEDAATNNLLVEFAYDTVIQTDVGSLELRPAGELYVTPYERHIQIDAKLTGNPSTQPTQVDFYTVAGLQFATTGAKYVYCQWEVPDDWEGTDIYFEVDWFPDSGAMSGADTVEWTVEYACVAEGEVHGAGTSKTLTVANNDDNARYKSIHSRLTMPFNDADQPLTVQDHVYFKVSRNTGVTNDFGGSVTVPAFEIIYHSRQIPRG